MGWYLECEVSPLSTSPGAPEVLEAVSVRGSGPTCNHGVCHGAIKQCTCDKISFQIQDSGMQGLQLFVSNNHVATMYVHILNLLIIS